MADMLADGLATLADELKAHASKTVSYTRTGQAAVNVQATIGRSELEQTDDEGLVTRFESRDFLIRAADLVIGGSATVPQRGDRIAETIGSTATTWEVMDLAGQPAWRYADPHRKMLRIHTKQVI